MPLNLIDKNLWRFFSFSYKNSHGFTIYRILGLIFDQSLQLLLLYLDAMKLGVILDAPLTSDILWDRGWFKKKDSLDIGGQLHAIEPCR